MREFKSIEIGQIKRTAQNVYPKVAKKNKILQQIEELRKEYEDTCEEIEDWETPIRKLTGGYTTEQLVDRVVEDTGKLNKDGAPIKTTKYVLKYPDTVVPPEPEETDKTNMDDFPF